MLNNLLIITIIIGLLGVIIYYINNNNKKKKEDKERKQQIKEEQDNDNNNNEEEEEEEEENKEKKKNIKKEKKNTTKQQIKTIITSNKNKFNHAINQKEHSLFWKEIGGHITPSSCVAFSPKNNLIASTSQDGMIRGLPLSEVGVASAHDIYTNVGGLSTALAFTQNGRRIVVAINGTLKFYSFIISDSERKFEFVKKLETGFKFISSIQLLDVEQWMVIVISGRDEFDEPCVRAFDRNGTRIANFVQIKRKGRVDKNRIPLPKKALTAASPDDRFIVIYGVGEAEGVKDGDVGIFEIVRDKATGHATGLSLSFAFAGHTSDVVACGWNSNGKKFITCCEDGSWRLWDATIQYYEHDKPRLYSDPQSLPNGVIPSHVAIMKGDIVVFAAGRDLIYCTSGSGEVISHIQDATVTPIISTAMSVNGQYFATVVENVKRIAIFTSPS